MPLGMHVGLIPGDFVLDGDPVPLPKGGDFGPCLLWPHGWMDQDATWHKGRPQPRRLCFRWGPSPLPTKGVEHSPQFSAHFYCGQTVGCIKMPLGMKVGLIPRDFVLDGDPAPPPTETGGGAPQFSAHDYCGQTAGWTKMALGMEVGLGPVHIVLDGDTASLPKKGTKPPIFGPSLLWPNGWMHQNATWYGGRPQPRRLCVRWDPITYPKRGGAPLNFRPTSIVAKWLHGSRCYLARR